MAAPLDIRPDIQPDNLPSLSRGPESPADSHKKIKSQLEKDFFNKSAYEQKKFLDTIALEKPKFGKLLHQLYEVNYRKILNEKSQLTPSQVTSYYSERIIKILDHQETAEKFLSHADIGKFTIDDWKFYIGLVSESKDGEKILTGIDNFIEESKKPDFADKTPEQKLVTLTQSMGKYIYDIATGTKNVSPLAKVRFIESYINKHLTHPINLSEILAGRKSEIFKQQELYDMALLSSATYMPRNDTATYIPTLPHERNNDQMDPVSEREYKKAFTDWIKVIGTILKQQNGKIDIQTDPPEKLRTLLADKYPWMQVNFKNLRLSGSNQQKNQQLLEACFKNIYAYHESDRHKFLMDHSEALSQYKVLEQSSEFFTGFFISTYQHKTTGKIILSIRGTDSLFPLNPDLWGNDLQIGLAKHMKDIRPAQLTSLQKYLNKFSKKYAQELQNNKVIITGHSLGGTLAQLAASNDIDIPKNIQLEYTVNFNGPSIVEPGDIVREHITGQNMDGIGNRGIEPATIASISSLGALSLHGINNIAEGLTPDKKLVIVDQSLIRETRRIATSKK